MSDETMIDRVAKAMISAYPKAGRTFGESSQLPGQVFTDLAIATIEAMRRPTLVMLRAAWAADESHTIPRDELVKAYPGEDTSGDVGVVLDYDNKGLEVIVGAWEAMIGAALNEKAAADP